MSAYPVFAHHLVVYRRAWRGTVFSSFLLPVLFFVAMGLTVGRYVDRSGSLGVPYTDYIAPGVLASTALQVAVGESTWPVMSNFTWTRTYHAMRATPLRVADMVAGQLGYVLLRVLVSSAGFLAVMTAFGTVHSVWGPAALPVAVLVGFATAAPIFAYSASIANDSLFALLNRFAVIPMTLFSGVFFPVDSLPFGARLLAYVSPLWHGVELSRAATLGAPTAWGVWTHLACLVAWIAIGYPLAVVRFKRRLGD
jgi:lipooligosaccharide transport system permease protein